MRMVYEVTVDQPKTAVEALSAVSGLSRQRIKDAMSKGACWWTQKGKQLRLRRATRQLPIGTKIRLCYDDQVLARVPEAAELIEDRKRYSVWYKPHGLLSQGSQWGDHCSLLRLVELHLKRSAYLVHRLDGDAAGLMLIAHDPKAAAALSHLFAGHAMHKCYQAHVSGELRVQNRLIDMPIDGKQARSRITTLEYDAAVDRTLLRVVIETGRKHQIRRHLAGIGHPIIGDRLYHAGFKGQPPSSPLQLVAVELGFDCPFERQPVQFLLPERLMRLSSD